MSYSAMINHIVTLSITKHENDNLLSETKKD